MRTLIEVKIIHDPKDMGLDLSSEFQEMYQRAEVHFPDKLHQYLSVFNRYWDEIDQFLGGYPITKIYQEGTFPSVRINYRDVILNHFPESRNKRTLCTLIGKGALIIPVEDRRLIEESIYFIQDGNLEHLNQSIRKRDEKIAENINGNLKEEETGVLLVGGNHSVGSIVQQNYRSIELISFTGNLSGVRFLLAELERELKELELID